MTNHSSFFIYCGAFILVWGTALQLHHRAIMALKQFPDAYLLAGKPEPGAAIGWFNWRYTVYLYRADFSGVTDISAVRKLQWARVALWLSDLIFVSLIIVMIVFTSR
ncbi:MAG: hypothetical protein HWE13_08960 [Gammaproteobacteria bacterium]|nr:hypothetical protein [Gammaproteobacteria bacterium]NVK88244.1 hypothetical protein [Gammaproteobacteria bacterium]